jgi:hypothetical protein
MRNILTGILLCAMLASCSSGTENKNTVSVERTDTLQLSFSVIDKDSAHVVNYRFERKAGEGKGFSFNYANEADSFTLFLDTSKGIYGGKFGKGGTVSLDLEGMKYYTINRGDFKVLKLTGDKNVTDGAFSIFLSPDFGLLVSKSNTWRTAKVMCPDKSNNNYVQLSALLYRVQTDYFFKNPVTDLNKKIIPPKVE